MLFNVFVVNENKISLMLRTEFFFFTLGSTNKASSIVNRERPSAASALKIESGTRN